MEKGCGEGEQPVGVVRRLQWISRVFMAMIKCIGRDSPTALRANLEAIVSFCPRRSIGELELSEVFLFLSPLALFEASTSASLGDIERIVDGPPGIRRYQCLQVLLSFTMSETTNGVGIRHKRKRRDGDLEVRKNKRQDTRGVSERNDNFRSRVLFLQEKIRESRKNYNSISTLLEYAQDADDEIQENMVAVEALFRVFCRLMAAGSLIKSSDSSENEATVVQWLKERYQDYKSLLLELLGKADAAKQSTALTLLLRLVKKEKAFLSTSDDAVWRSGVFAKLIRALLADTTADETRQEFVTEYLGKFHDVRYYTFEHLADTSASDTSESILQNTLFLLTAVESIPENQDSLGDFFIDPLTLKHDLYSLAAHKKQAQKAWIAVLRKNLSKSQRKTVLEVVSHRIAPWFLKVELLMDFLTDSFNIGGSSSLMALSGLFYLIQHKNLDYPQFYQKLYSLLDSNVLHSKHRSRFFRLLDTFLASTHLPAALVASFIKRLSRLALNAPPSAIVIVIPWIYNLLKNHPSCAFMIHRDGNIDQDESGWGDPFLMDEPDPMESDALESSLWEVHMLQTHYHPNVATIAKIISEQFTKQAYNLEDFLDHSYGTVRVRFCSVRLCYAYSLQMLDAELSKDIKKPPEIEYEIPKRIFLRYDAESGKEDSLLVKLWGFS